MSRLAAMLRQRCPACRRGKIFRQGLEVHEVCPECGLRFMRESGYFLGAMYISYFLSLPALTLIVWFLGRSTPWPPGARVIAAGLLFAPFIPLVVRCSRVFWIYWDRWVDPGA